MANLCCIDYDVGSGSFSAIFPELEIATSGETLIETIFMAVDAVELHRSSNGYCEKHIKIPDTYRYAPNFAHKPLKEIIDGFYKKATYIYKANAALF